MTLLLYARRKGWPLSDVAVSLRHERVHAEDCADCEEAPRLLDRIERVIALEGELSQEQRQRLLQIAERCPVHRTLTSAVRIDSRLA